MSGLDFLFNKKKRKSYFDGSDDHEDMENQNHHSLLDDQFLRNQKSHTQGLRGGRDSFQNEPQQTPYLKSNYDKQQLKVPPSTQRELDDFPSASMEINSKKSNPIPSFRGSSNSSFEEQYEDRYDENSKQQVSAHNLRYEQTSVPRAEQSTQRQRYDYPPQPSVSQHRRSPIHEPHDTSIGLNERLAQYDRVPAQPIEHISHERYYVEPTYSDAQPRNSHAEYISQHNHYENSTQPFSDHNYYGSSKNYNAYEDAPVLGPHQYYNPPPVDPYLNQSRRMDEIHRNALHYRESPLSDPHYNETRINNRLFREDKYVPEYFMPHRSSMNLLPKSQQSNDQYDYETQERAMPSRDFTSQSLQHDNANKDVGGKREQHALNEKLSNPFISKTLIRKILWIGLGFLCSSLFGAGVYWYLRPSDSSGIPIIKAAKGPYKISNDKVQYTDIHKDNVIYDRLMPHGSLPLEGENVLESNEETIDPLHFEDEDEIEDPIPVAPQSSSDYAQQNVLTQEGQPSILQNSPAPLAQTYQPEPAPNVDEAIQNLRQNEEQNLSVSTQKKIEKNVQKKLPFLIQLGTLGSSKKASSEKKRLQKKYQKLFTQEIEIRQTVLNSGQKVYRLLVHLKFSNLNAAKSFCKSIGGACKVSQP
ncbi:MAG: hypothetical protein C0432_02135 [Candidatus Puniceispirillum sp.]|nr:hypothetical protein [Candidatus Pelagibacter sp.]MBA4283074.1 hypothetical protein [Candidatus Puniceispirillum sp.]